MALTSFPEEKFAPASHLRNEYETRVARGMARMKESTVVIAGLARNISHVFERTSANIDQLGGMFKDYRVVIYENDSSDDTPQRLTAHAQANPQWHVVSESRGDPVNPTARCLKRAERMAIYRNAYLDIVRERYSDFGYAIVVDTDLAVGWSCLGVANTFGHEGWDFMGSNGIIYRRKGLNPNLPMQYDAWAFRLDEAYTALTTREVNVMQFQRGEPPVAVTCCFGGLGVYRMPVFLAGRYAGDDIDHVTHLRRARAAGFGKVFLNPSQLTIYGRHWRKSDRFYMPLLRNVLRKPILG